MKKLHEPLENGLIPLVEIAKIIYGDEPDEDTGIDFNKPEFYKDELLVHSIGERNGCGITMYLFFENNQFKLRNYDAYWTSDNNLVRVEVIDTNPLPLYKKLEELGITLI